MITIVYIVIKDDTTLAGNGKFKTSRKVYENIAASYHYGSCIPSALAVVKADKTLSKQTIEESISGTDIHYTAPLSTIWHICLILFRVY